MKEIIISLLASIVFISPLSGQRLDELLLVAFDNNPELKALENEYMASKQRTVQVSELPDPEIGIGTFPMPVQTRVGAQLARISATHMFPWKGVIDGRKDLETARSNVLYERISAKALDLFYEIKQDYLHLYELRESQSIIERNISLLETLERLTLTKVESGTGSAADVLRVQVKIKELEQEISILESASLKPIASINQGLNRSPDIPIFIQDSLTFAMILFDKDSLYSIISKSHPLLKMFDLEQEVSRQAMSLNELNSKPSFGVGMDYILVNGRNDVVISGNGRDIVQFRATMKVPLYKKKYAAKEKEELLKISAVDHKKTELMNRFSEAIEQAYADLSIAQLRMELYDQQIFLTRAAINILETEYSTKGVNFDELLRLENELINYDLKKLKVIVQSHLAKSTIERFISA
jgi:outer membrane protein TolC